LGFITAHYSPLATLKGVSWLVGLPTDKINAEKERSRNLVAKRWIYLISSYVYCRDGLRVLAGQDFSGLGKKSWPVDQIWTGELQFSI
jgi:hypothetical protein